MGALHRVGNVAHAFVASHAFAWLMWLVSMRIVGGGSTTLTACVWVFHALGGH